jgi:hypothetical protein
MRSASRVVPLVALLAFCMATSSTRSQPFYHKKRKSKQWAPEADAHYEGVIESLRESIRGLFESIRGLLSPKKPAGGYDMSVPGDRQKLIDYLWAQDYHDCETETLDANPELEDQLQTRTRNRTSGDDAELAQTRRRGRLNFLAGTMARNKSKNIMPKDQVLMGIDAKAKMMNARQWDTFSKNRVLPSRTWMRKHLNQKVTWM